MHAFHGGRGYSFPPTGTVFLRYLVKSDLSDCPVYQCTVASLDKSFLQGARKKGHVYQVGLYLNILAVHDVLLGPVDDPDDPELHRDHATAQDVNSVSSLITFS